MPTSRIGARQDLTSLSVTVITLSSTLIYLRAGQWHHGDMRHELWVLLIILFGWPAGIVVGNLLANLVWLPVQWVGLHLKLAAHHNALHGQLARIEHLLEACPHCGHRRSDPSLLPSMQAPSIVVASKDTEA